MVSNDYNKNYKCSQRSFFANFIDDFSDTANQSYCRMVLTAADRAKRYRAKLKEKHEKYLVFKQKDRQRKSRKRALMTKEQREKHLIKHQHAQRKHREKLEKENEDQQLPK